MGKKNSERIPRETFGSEFGRISDIFQNHFHTKTRSRYARLFSERAIHGWEEKYAFGITLFPHPSRSNLATSTRTRLLPRSRSICEGKRKMDKISATFNPFSAPFLPALSPLFFPLSRQPRKYTSTRPLSTISASALFRTIPDDPSIRRIEKEREIDWSWEWDFFFFSYQRIKELESWS